MNVITAPVMAESLFKAGVSQSFYSIQPRPLFSTVRAKNIGDLITVAIEHSVSSSDNVQLEVKKSSDTTDNFTGVLNSIFNHKYLPNVDGFGGDAQTKNQSTLSRSSSIKDTVTTQVVQVLPNGNLVIQGRKTAINAGEQVEMVISGIVDPRLLDNTGSIKSSLVANLQVAVIGKGTVSGSDSESMTNKLFKRFF